MDFVSFSAAEKLWGFFFSLLLRLLLLLLTGGRLPRQLFYPHYCMPKLTYVLEKSPQQGHIWQLSESLILFFVATHLSLYSHYWLFCSMKENTVETNTQIIILDWIMTRRPGQIKQIKKTKQRYKIYKRAAVTQHFSNFFWNQSQSNFCPARSTHTHMYVCMHVCTVCI